jgi:DNA-dependent RNA polymerase auxiliary subunit epsilon
MSYSKFFQRVNINVPFKEITETMDYDVDGKVVYGQTIAKLGKDGYEYHIGCIVGLNGRTCALLDVSCRWDQNPGRGWTGEDYYVHVQQELERLLG